MPKRFSVKMGVALLCILFAHQNAHAMWMRSESLEWKTQMSDLILLAKVSRVHSILPLNEYYDSQEVECASIKCLKGNGLQNVTFRQDYPHRGKGIGSEKPLKPGTRVMLFIQRTKRNTSDEVHFWVNIDKPEPKLEAHAAYDNNCNCLSKGDRIVDLVSARVKLDSTNNFIKKRGLIVRFKGSERWDMYWDFVRTADPEFKNKLVEQIKKPISDKTALIHNLVSYPDEDTARIIRSFLADLSTSEVHLYGPNREDITYYPVRQAAYLALTLMGKTVERPSPYYDLIRPGLFEDGMDNTDYFPDATWKTLDKR